MKKGLTADMVKEEKTLHSARNCAMWSVTFTELPELERVDDFGAFWLFSNWI